MKSVNKVILIGRAGQDADLIYTQAGQARAIFRLATDEGVSSDGEKITGWHNIVLWDKKAELASQYVKKGRLVYLEGRLRYSEYKDKNGQDCLGVEITAYEFTLLDAKPSEVLEREPVGVGSRRSGELQKGENVRFIPDIGDNDDIPF